MWRDPCNLLTAPTLPELPRLAAPGGLWQHIWTGLVVIQKGSITKIESSARPWSSYDTAITHVHEVAPTIRGWSYHSSARRQAIVVSSIFAFSWFSFCTYSLFMLFFESCLALDIGCSRLYQLLSSLPLTAASCQAVIVAPSCIRPNSCRFMLPSSLVASSVPGVFQRPPPWSIPSGAEGAATPQLECAAKACSGTNIYMLHFSKLLTNSATAARDNMHIKYLNEKREMF